MEIRDLVRERIIGNIKIGMKGENGLPKKLSYFHVEEDKGTSRDMVDIFKQLYPGKATKLKIRFTTENPFNFKFKRYVNGKAVCIGNGTKAITVGKDSKNNNTQIEVECSQECQHYQSGKCKLKGSLKFVLEGIEAGGVWNLSTSGGISLTNIASEIYKYKKAGMSIVDVPFELTLTEQESLAYGTYYSIDLRGSDMKPQLIDSTIPKLVEGNTKETKQLTEGTKKESENTKTTARKTTKGKNNQEITESKTVSAENKDEEKNTNMKQTGDSNSAEETKPKEDFSNHFILISCVPTIINGIKFNQFTFENINKQCSEYILHPKANQDILKCGIGTQIEITKTKVEMEKNVLCQYVIKQKVEQEENNENVNVDSNSEELKEAV